MVIKRVLTFAAVLAIGASMAAPAFADAEEEKEIIEFKADASMLTTDDSAPTISFDTADWKNYVHLTTEAEKINLKISDDKKTFYQGASMKVTSDSAGIEGQYYNYAESAKNDAGEFVYPDASADGTVYATPGFELRAADFGLSCFDGCLITFKYRIGSDVKGKLMDNSIIAFPADEAYNHLANNPTKLTYDDLTNNNVSTYRTQMIPVADAVSATKIVFQIPITTKVSSDIFYIDNIQITIPEKDSNGSDQYIKNIDSFNSNAKPQETIEEIQIQEKGNTISTVDESSSDSKSSGVSPIIIVVAVIAGLLIVGVIVLVVIKAKNKFY